MSRYKSLYIGLLLAWVLVGCSNPNWVRQDDDSPFNLPPIGTVVVLKKPLTIGAGQTRVFLQRGEIVPKAKFDRYWPNCNFEVRTLAQEPQTIQPEDFLVVRLQRQMEQVVELSQPVLLAGFGLPGFFHDGPLIVRGLHLWLGSDRQPDVMRLTCRGAFADLWRADPPSIAEMREALGDYAELVLP